MFWDRVTYYLALITLLTVPATLIAWLFIHGLLSRWRRMGATKASISVSVITILTMGGMYLVHKPLLQIHFGFYWPLAVIAILFLGISAYLNIRVYQATPKSMALGLAELSADVSGKLITTGIYSRMRHPRFSAMTLAVASMALITGYAVLYILIGIYIIGIYIVALLEDRELLERFGPEYYDYAKCVPRFIPNAYKRRTK